MLHNYLFNHYIVACSLGLVMALNAFSIPDTNGKVCYRGGDKNQVCKSNCPPCWKQESNNVFSCFEYKNGKCLFDWVDVSGNSESGNSSSSSSSSASETTSSKKQSSKESSTNDKGNNSTSKGKGDEGEENTTTSTVTSQINGKKSPTSTVVLVVTSSKVRKTITAEADSGCQINSKFNSLALVGIVSLYHILN